MSKKLKIGVINIYNFPKGMAPTTRIIAYCKGLVSCGVDVDIISIKPKTRSHTSDTLHGTCDGGKYHHFKYAPKCSIPIIRSILWRLYNVYCLYKALHFIKKENSLKQYDCFILSFDAPPQLHTIVHYLRKHTHATILAIADEYPRPIRDFMKDSVPKYILKMYNKIYNSIDGRILMTHKLQEFYDTNVSPKPTLILSTIVDTDRFHNVTSTVLNREYLCYMGNMSLKKDNVDNIVEAFDLIKDDYPSLDLHLYGTPSSEDRQYIQSIINKLGLQYRALIKGKVDYENVPQVLSNAKILVTSQPDTKRAEGGFPTKMGEYFMTGVPAILTDVGEIGHYVTNKKNGYMVSPCNPKAYAEGLRYILEHYDEALEVAQNAKAYIEKTYDYKCAGRSIVDFINTFK